MLACLYTECKLVLDYIRIKAISQHNQEIDNIDDEGGFLCAPLSGSPLFAKMSKFPNNISISTTFSFYTRVCGL